MKHLITLLAILLIAFGCGNQAKEKNGQKMYGTYECSTGKYQKIEFGKKIDGTIGEGYDVVIDENFGSSYHVDGNEVIIAATPSVGGNIMFQIVDEKNIKGENGDTGIYTRQ